MHVLLFGIKNKSQCRDERFAYVMIISFGVYFKLLFIYIFLFVGMPP